ncbi:hypothetical protein ACQP1G_24245 [Nocardia sp. CA-107356]|uniref:hypothetical protein n=1 Tax=Nocardia sp. CA-107356 TaxID=3239972 RepID=UPI003D8BCC9B
MIRHLFKDIPTVYGKGTKTRQECQDYIADSHRSLVELVETWVTDFESLAGLRELVRAANEPFVDADRSTSILSIEYVAVDSDHTGIED